MLGRRRNEGKSSALIAGAEVFGVLGSELMIVDTLLNGYIESLTALANYALYASEEVACGTRLVFDSAAPVILAGADDELFGVSGHGVEEG